mmetsp:Transcript_38861/g.67282  ORF Transcript_38861/g.67282 Transcript_38861/m.67282 type:complete len:217 (+) Transcript_38861:79-729(+)
MGSIMGCIAAREDVAEEPAFTKSGKSIFEKKHITRNDINAYIEIHAELWAMLAVNLNKSEEFCKQTATEVAYDMAKTQTSPTNNIGSSPTLQAPEVERRVDREGSFVTQNQFKSFRSEWVKNPYGQQEFFQRCVFAVFDVDQSKALDQDELSNFLDVFYEAGSIFAGDLRLPDKTTLQQIVSDRLDKNHDSLLTFEELRGLISGTADISHASTGGL